MKLGLLTSPPNRGITVIPDQSVIVTNASLPVLIEDPDNPTPETRCTLSFVYTRKGDEEEEEIVIASFDKHVFEHPVQHATATEPAKRAGPVTRRASAASTGQKRKASEAELKGPKKKVVSSKSKEDEGKGEGKGSSKAKDKAEAVEEDDKDSEDEDSKDEDGDSEEEVEEKVVVEEKIVRPAAASATRRRRSKH
ncbi:hypothetical protein H1R20_g15020, partial [Candolleomyces eurysporus]